MLPDCCLEVLPTCMSALSKLSTRRGGHHDAWGGVQNMGARGPVDSATRGISATTSINKLARDVSVDMSSRVTFEVRPLRATGVCHLSTQKVGLSVIEGSAKMVSLPGGGAHLLCPTPTPTVPSVRWVAVGTCARAGPS
jgi:hypothetical protein